MNIGEILSIEHHSYTSNMGWIKALRNGFSGPGEADLKDNLPAILEIDGMRWYMLRRLFTFARTYSWNDLLALLMRLYPEQVFTDDIEGLRGQEYCCESEDGGVAEEA